MFGRNRGVGPRPQLDVPPLRDQCRSRRILRRNGHCFNWACWHKAAELGRAMEFYGCTVGRTVGADRIEP